ncbi:MAG: ABC transporter ATP-binding protein [Candidatus Curtissbacteria bacterium]|nr:ABC transporter ATP-binding protein [Candidatus Curtissbacteria bacterium]
MSSQPIIIINNLSFSYALPSQKQLEVLKNITLSVDPGEFVSIIGPSGCGKTTLLMNIKRLLKGNEGQISVDSNKISMVFQNSSLFPWRTVEENVAYGLEIKGGLTKTQKENTVKKHVKLVGLSGFEKFYPAKLSGGMKQRVNLARALAVDPDIILMDEPFASLDAQTRELMQEELLKIWTKQKKTVIFVTHQVSEAAYLSDRVIVLTKRPAAINASIDINLKRPRTNGLRTSKKFVDYEKQLNRLIRKESPN